MDYQEEKFKKIVKIGLVVMGVILVLGFFSLFFGGGSSPKKYNNTGIGLGGGKITSGNDFQNPMSVSVGDSASMERSSQGMMVESKVAEEGFMESPTTDVTLVDKKVIKNGNLSLKVGSTDWATGEISNIVKQKGGEVFSTNFYERVKGQKSGFVTIKVPVDKFKETVSDIKKIATQVLNESTTGQDVTEQYTDFQAQLKNKRAEEESFVKILGTAGKIDDVLAVTREVSRVRGEIERLEGRIRFMDSQTDMSTITINLTEDVTVIPVSEGWRPWQVVKQSIKELVANVQDFADGIIRFIIVGIPSLIPFALLLGFLYWVGKKIFKKISA